MDWLYSPWTIGVAILFLIALINTCKEGRYPEPPKKKRVIVEQPKFGPQYKRARLQLPAVLDAKLAKDPMILQLRKMNFCIVEEDGQLVAYHPEV